MLSDYFSTDYFAARDRFRVAAKKVGLSLISYPLHKATEIVAPGSDDPLTIDVAISGRRDAINVTVVSSGVHGIEGYFGSAVQLALLEALCAQRVTIGHHQRLVLIHALNPYGFANLRRWNEDGVDLNRNFLRLGEAFAGSPPLYSQIDPWLNPQSPPHLGLALPPRGLIDPARFGFDKLMQTIPVGQYDYPSGLFFGGNEPTESTRTIQHHLGEWVGEAGLVTHLDFHTGLGRYAKHALLLDVRNDHGDADWFRGKFGNNIVSALPAADGAVKATKIYSPRGALGQWCISHFADRRYRFATAEFGTYGPLTVLHALRQENRAHHFGGGDEKYAWTKRRLLEIFVPASQKWRERVVDDGLQLILSALGATQRGD